MRGWPPFSSPLSFYSPAPDQKKKNDMRDETVPIDESRRHKNEVKFPI